MHVTKAHIHQAIEEIINFLDELKSDEVNETIDTVKWRIGQGMYDPPISDIQTVNISIHTISVMMEDLYLDEPKSEG